MGLKNLVSREDYIKEYLHIDRNIENEDEIYEGLLSTMFGGLKMLFKRDWANIKCKNPSVIEYLKEIDQSLSGYTMVKMQYYNECKTIRQNIANYFSDILEYKLKQIEKTDNIDEFIESENKEKKNTTSKGVSKKMNIKDKTVLDSLDKYKKNIKTACRDSSKLTEYAEQMLNSVIVFVNDVVLNELEKKGVEKEKLEEERKKNEEEMKRLKEIRQKMNKMAKDAGEEKLKKLSNERDKSMRTLGVNPITSMKGDKSIDVIVNQFSDMLGEFNDLKINESKLPDEYSEILRSDTYIGIQKSLDDLDLDFDENTEESIYNKFLIRVILNKIKTVFEVVSNNKKMFGGVPSTSVQAMLISLSNAVIYGFMGKEKFDIEKSSEILSLMSKCAIYSDATIGFNLPLMDPKNPDDGNFFVSIMDKFKNANINSQEVEDAVNTMSNKDLKSVLNVFYKNSGVSDEEEITPEEGKKFAKEFSSKVTKDFRQNMSTLLDTVIENAYKLLSEKEE